MNRKNGKDLRKTIPSMEFIEEKIFAIPRDRDQAFVAALWLTGGRLNEVLAMKRRNMSFVEDGDKLKIRMITLKNKVQMERVIHLYIKGHEKITRLLIDYFKRFDKEECPFTFSDRTGERIVSRWFPTWFPHLFRHYRASYMATNPKVNDVKLQAWFGWADPKSSRVYIHLNPNVTIDMDY